jgi:uncharacterized protein (TIGR02145 family)
MKRKKIRSLLVTSSLVLINTFSYAQNVTVGTQVWMVQNLNVDKFRNGDPITEAKTDAEWEAAGKNGKPAWCYINNDSTNGGKYGKLYNWYAVNDPRGLAPKGWHIPTDNEWLTLTEYLGGEQKAGAKMKSKTGWPDHVNVTKNTNIINKSGFSGLPFGYRGQFFGKYPFVGPGVKWWSSTEGSVSDAWYRSLEYSNDAVFRSKYPKDFGLSIRCVRD